MELSTKQKVGIVVVYTVVVFAFGRYSNVYIHTKDTTTKDTSNTTKDDKQKKDKQTDKKKTTTTTEESDKDGHTKKTVTVVEDTTTKETAAKDTKTADTSTKNDTDKEVTKSGSTSKTHINVLAGANVIHPEQGFVYGAEVGHDVIGPMSVGLFGLSNGTLGGSVGVNF